MAFTAEQKRDIRKYLGAPMGFYDKNTRLESMMDLVGATSTDQAEVETWLTRLATIDVALTGSNSTTISYGPLKQVDEIQFYQPQDASDDGGSIGLISQGRVLIDRLARAFGVDDYLPSGDYFGAKRPMSFSYQLG